ncbi:hypothetical protein [Amycolatopsis vastitatis]|uniref:Uncharacterized protein n=1 Tax=Amycolatopsis vastitatis TaxID=1905142 RepID=A0A229TEV6_9PSEU|nr:hypothetical protein [Amycolatopsis vastitatis]OXM69766.1 hypothetical protein CF165_09700 [Amycolatopsis vastitatis]
MTANAYSFLPWLRTGLATRITEDPGTAARASITVRLRLTGDGLDGKAINQPVAQPVQIYGPGDVIGVDPRAISRMEPRPFVTNVEPNYFAHLEFYDEALPWSYSPAAPDAVTERLRPWLALIVLAAGDGADAEFAEGTVAGRPLPFITVTGTGALQPPDQLGAWAHVHVNGGLDGPVASDDMAAVLPELRSVLDTNADNACSRIVCPRHLRPATAYQAFLVPAFETGRLAGLGLDPAAAPGALHPSWGVPYAGRQAAGQLPYYHRWGFSTGAAGDFEDLVRLLEPRVPDEHVARRDIDVFNSAGFKLPGITEPPEIGGILRLGGALEIPLRKKDNWDNWDSRFTAEDNRKPENQHNPYPPPLGTYPHPFQKALAGLINLAEDYTRQPPAAAHERLAGPAAATRVDPVVTPPLYGRWPALRSRLLVDDDGSPTPAPENKNWVHRLNLDPRFRVAANFGTQVVQARQEEFMAAAWAQIGDVLKANARIRAAQLHREVGHRLQRKHIGDPAADPEHLAAAPSASGKALTLTAPAHSRVTHAPFTAPAAAGADVGGPVAVGFQVATSRVAAAPLSPEMRRLTRPGSRLMRTLEVTADALVPRMDLDTGAVTAAAPKTTPGALVTPDDVENALPQVVRRSSGGDRVGQLPVNDKFVLSLPGEGIAPAGTPGHPDSPEAALFKKAVGEIYGGWSAAAVGGQVTPPPKLDVARTTGSVLRNLSADVTVPRNLLTTVKLESERLQPFAERFLEAMAYPAIDLPMFQSLLDKSVDTFVPNLTLIPPNSITLLETDQEFVEAFLVGLNHELGREMLWREYPTDQRGTPFRQFWDPRAAFSPPGEPPAARRERLYDVTPIDTWGSATPLGAHDNRELAGDKQENELVLVIRGELLKKYPTAAVYAHRARWEPDNRHPDPHRERVPVELADENHPTSEEIKLPLYEAKVEPDIYLLGFDLTAEKAKGNFKTGDAGWFFVLKERPGDPRFGVDDGAPTRVEVWNDLSWGDVDPGGRHGFVVLDQDTAEVPLLDFDDPAGDEEKEAQHAEDVALPRWYAGLSSADLAYLLFQAPVLMAVHAQEMLLDDPAH